jgi:PhnB protein
MPDHDPMQQLDQAIESLLAGAGVRTASDPSLAALVNVAADLRHFPVEGFKERLKKDLERRAIMTTATATPVKFRTVTPFLIHAQAPALVEFMETTFGAEVLKRKTSGPNDFYSEVRIGDTVLMIAGGAAASYGNVPSALHVYVDDCDAAYHRGLSAGAKTLMGALGEPADRPYGERSAFLEDAFGNYWYIATRFASTPLPERAPSVMPYFHPRKVRPYMEFLDRAFAAAEGHVVEQAGRVMHAYVNVGDAVIEMGEPDDNTGMPTNGVFFVVDDVEAVYQRALDAGATVIRPPANEPANMRSGVVRDPEGYFWWPAKWLR